MQKTKTVRSNKSFFTPVLHNRVLAFYMFIVLAHFAEHIVQAVQVFMLGWSRPEAGGLLGEQFPGLATNEFLHFAYNLLLIIGLLVLYRGFSGKARTYWGIAVLFQGWHFVEHFLLQAQWLTGVYLFNASRQTSMLENFVPRIELHFIYNTIVTLPIVIAVVMHGFEHSKVLPASATATA